MINAVLGYPFAIFVDQLTLQLAPHESALVIVLDISALLQPPEAEHRSTIRYLQSSHRVTMVHVPTLVQLLALIAKCQLDLCNNRIPRYARIATWGLLSTYATNDKLNLILSRLCTLTIPVLVAEVHETAEYTQILKFWTNHEEEVFVDTHIHLIND